MSCTPILSSPNGSSCTRMQDLQRLIGLHRLSQTFDHDCEIFRLNHPKKNNLIFSCEFEIHNADSNEDHIEITNGTYSFTAFKFILCKLSGFIYDVTTGDNETSVLEMNDISNDAMKWLESFICLPKNQRLNMEPCHTFSLLLLVTKYDFPSIYEYILRTFPSMVTHQFQYFRKFFVVKLIYD